MLIFMSVSYTHLDVYKRQVHAFVEKDRSGAHKAGDDIEDPSLLDWQAVIDNTAQNKNFVIKNTIQEAIKTEERKYAQEIGVSQEAEPQPEGGTGGAAQSLCEEITPVSYTHLSGIEKTTLFQSVAAY